MAKKLTLNIDERVIQEAKKYANKKRKSLSRLIQDYLQYILETENKDKETDFSPTVKQLLGSIIINDKNIKDAKYEYLKEKYLVENGGKNIGK